MFRACVSSVLQVSSRVWLVWGILVAAPAQVTARGLDIIPFKGLSFELNLITLLVAWSVTEIIRYSFFAVKVSLCMSVEQFGILPMLTLVVLAAIAANAHCCIMHVFGMSVEGLHSDSITVYMVYNFLTCNGCAFLTRLLLMSVILLQLVHDTGITDKGMPIFSECFFFSRNWVTVHIHCCGCDTQPSLSYIRWGWQVS